MTLLSVQNATRYFGANQVLDSITFQVAQGEKVALVGANGAGKSTLLRSIAGQVALDGGQIHLARGVRLAYLAQDASTALDGSLTLWQTMEAALVALREMQTTLHELALRMGQRDAPDWDETMQRYGDLSARFELAGGYEMEQRIERTLQGLGFNSDNYARPLAHLSGGQTTRAALAAVLLSQPDLLLLDEPTNHLDLRALEWLETFLKGWAGTLLVTSHDRYFLDRVTTRTLEIEAARLEDYPAPYEHYLALKAERLERRMKEFVAQQEYIARTEEFIRRYKAGQRSKEARGRATRLERYKAQQAVDRPRTKQSLHLALESAGRSGDHVLTLDALEVGYQSDGDSSDPSGGDTLLLRADNLVMRRGERVGILGSNGSGKTTLLRTIVGELPPLRGRLLIGHHVQVGYFAQGHEVLRMDASVLDEVLRMRPTLGVERARTLLGRFLFSGDDVFKRVGDLSGGERNRVALAQLTLSRSNLLVMDEPTNHLDIDAREALEEVLRSYEGSILFVSHDRRFLDALADKLWVVEQQHLVEHLGSYSDYRTRQEQRAAQAKTQQQQQRAQQQRAHPTTQEQRQRKRRSDALEQQIARLERELEQTLAELEIASAAQDMDAITRLGRRYTELEQEVEGCFAAWAEVEVGEA